MKVELSFGVLSSNDWTSPDSIVEFTALETGRSSGDWDWDPTTYPFKDRLRLAERGTLWTLYLITLEYSASRSEYVLLDADETQILQRLAQLKDIRASLASQGSTSVPLLLSLAWLGLAARVIQRFLTNGSTDRTFCNDLIAEFNRRPHHPVNDIEGDCKEACGEYGFRFQNPVWSRKFRSTTARANLEPAAQVVLERYEKEIGSVSGGTHSTLKGSLVQSRDIVLETLEESRRILLNHEVMLLPLDSESPLWKNRFYIK